MVTLDVTFGRPELRSVRNAAREKDCAGLLSLLTNNVIDYQDRGDRVDVAAWTLGQRWGTKVPPALDRWVTEHPDDATAQLLRGAVEAVRAWEIRGFALAAQTPRHKMAGFHAALGNAETWLRAAAALEPDDPSPWHWLLFIARGQEVGLAETVERRYGLVKRAPEHFRGHLEAVKSLSPMWGYTTENMYEAVDDWTADAPPGSLLPALVFVAQIERFRKYGNAVTMSAELARTLAVRATDAMDMSVCERPAQFWAHNYAAGAYALIGDRTRAKAHFAVLRDYCTKYPWSDMGGRPTFVFRVQKFLARRG